MGRQHDPADKPLALQGQESWFLFLALTWHDLRIELSSTTPPHIGVLWFHCLGNKANAPLQMTESQAFGAHGDSLTQPFLWLIIILSEATKHQNSRIFLFLATLSRPTKNVHSFGPLVCQLHRIPVNLNFSPTYSYSLSLLICANRCQSIFLVHPNSPCSLICTNLCDCDNLMLLNELPAADRPSLAKVSWMRHG